MGNRPAHQSTREIFLTSKRICGVSRNAARRHLRIFFEFLERQSLTPETLTYQKMWQFDEELQRTQLSLSYRDVIRHTSQQYLFWLHKKRWLRADPSLIFPRTNFIHLNKTYLRYELPEDALNFLNWLRVTRARQTIASYKTNLKRFHLFIESNGISIENLRRTEVIQYLREQREKKYSESMFNHIVCETGVYLRWLGQEGKLKNSPDSLVTNQDYQKKPHFLPRPLERKVDLEIQRRLLESSDPYCQGLLLMRYTGIRIGELNKLPFHCFKKDSQDHALLKVPLAKLLKERMVPIDKKTVDLIQKIQINSKFNWKTLSKTSDPPYLLTNRHGRAPQKSHYQFMLEVITRDIPSDSPITPHRFRHTYATTLLGAGVNLLEIKELLGHRSIQMTLRYAKVTLPNIRESYYKAIALIEKNYVCPSLPAVQNHQNSTALGDLIKEIQRQTEELSAHARKPYAKMIRRIQSLRADLELLKLP